MAEEDPDCVLCREDTFAQRGSVPCGHTFHLECIKRVQADPGEPLRCPMCRAPYEIQGIHTLFGTPVHRGPPIVQIVEGIVIQILEPTAPVVNLAVPAHHLNAHDNNGFLEQWVNLFIEPGETAIIFAEKLYGFLRQYMEIHSVVLVNNADPKGLLGKILRRVFNIGKAYNLGTKKPGYERYRYRGIQLNDEGAAEFDRMMGYSLYG